jgi:hypothetical protein
MVRPVREDRSEPAPYPAHRARGAGIGLPGMVLRVLLLKLFAA